MITLISIKPSVTTWLADGTTEIWDFSFTGGYLTQDTVKAFYKSPAGVRTDLVVAGANFIGPYKLRFTPAVPSGYELSVYRDTSNGGLPFVDFQDGSSISESSLDTVAKQSVFTTTEAIDQAGLVTLGDIQDAAVAASASAGAAAASALTATNAIATVVAARDITTAARDVAVTASSEALRLTSKLRDIPSGFSWAGIVPKICLAPGQATYSEDVISYAMRVHSALIGSGEIWVDPVNGSDAASGTLAAPYKTLSYAVRSAAPSNIYCMPGAYAPFEFRDTDVPGAKLKILRAMGVCTIAPPADDPTTATWTPDGVYGSVYWMPLTPGNPAVLAVTDSGRRDDYDQAFPLTQYSSVANVNTPGEGWFHDTGANKLYVRLIAAANVNSAGVKARLRVVTGDATSKIMALGTKLAFDGDWRISGTYLQPVNSGALQASMFFRGRLAQPTVSYSYTHGLDALGANTYFEDTWFHRNRGDNLHYTDAGGFGCKATELNVKSTFAGDFKTVTSAPNTSNGSSVHLNSYIIRVNGLYARNYGPEIVDTGTGKSWLVGVDVGPGDNSGNAFGIYTTGPEMFVDTCAASGQAQADIAATTGGVLKQYATSYRTSSVAGGGTITTYTP